ncbi:MAG: tetratricopeptide repeat protein [Gemmataceae bacterium]|nr:tetratricopeptide repeat protein [Gemmataceae bacterium]MCI0737931.1 tetratricopeptide repeat protein [Gemmataceae bacterium]
MTATGKPNLFCVMFVAVFAFLLASFPARNSDVWAHLAAGRLLVAGEFSDAFLVSARFEAGGAAPWLYDLVLFGLYALSGGAGLVVAKAFVVVGVAMLLILSCRLRAGPLLGTLCVALALLTMGTRLLLVPATVSIFFLALTHFLLMRRKETARVSWMPVWPLLLLFVIWVQVDSRFVYGLGLVALVWLGEMLDTKTKGGVEPAFLAQRFVSFLILAAACVLNPSFVYAFTLPPEMRWLVGGAPSALSPFQFADFFAAARLSPASLAYFPLLALGLLSIGLAPHWVRFLPFLAAALLSAFQARAIPFFAVVACPLLAWNLVEFLEKKETWVEKMRRRRAPAFGALVCVVLLVCAWPGWLQAPPFEPRRWALEPPAALERAALAARRWQEVGRLRDAGGLHLSADTANAFAWYCPESKTFFDQRLNLAAAQLTEEMESCATRMRDWGLNHVVVYDDDRGRLFAALSPFFADPAQWPLLHLEGNAAIFGWRDQKRIGAEDPYRGWEQNLDQLAFQTAQARRAPRHAADEDGKRYWWEAFWKPAPPVSIDREESAVYLSLAELARRSASVRQFFIWANCELASLVGGAANWPGCSGLVDGQLRVTALQPQHPRQGLSLDSLPGPDWLAHQLRREFFFQLDDIPPATLYLGIRAARRALAVNPEDAQSYLTLGECYVRLMLNTRERSWGLRVMQLLELRRAQASAALKRAIELKPNYAQAHLTLGSLYRDMGSLDLALAHLSTYADLERAKGPTAGFPEEAFERQLDQLTARLAVLAKAVESGKEAYEKEAAGRRVLDRASLALQHGLAGKALQELEKSNVAAFGIQGMILELNLLLKAGRARDVWEWTDPEHRSAIGAAEYHWLRVQALAALGEYALAEEECNHMILIAQSRQEWAVLLGQSLMDELPREGFLPHACWLALQRPKYLARMALVEAKILDDANVQVLRGILALEEGAVEEAKAAFESALLLGSQTASGGGAQFYTRFIAEQCLTWLK